MRWSRRKLIMESAKLLPLGMGLSWLPASAWGRTLSTSKNTKDGHFFVLMQAYGGMHAPLGLDPVLPQNFPKGASSNEIYLGKNASQIINTGTSHPGSGILLGPTAAPLLPFIGSCAVINGVFMSPGVAHPDSLLYVTTGNYKGQAATVPAELWLASGRQGGIFVNTSLYSGNIKDLPVNSIDYFENILASGEDASEVRLSLTAGQLKSQAKSQADGQESPLETAKRLYVEEGRKRLLFKRLFAKLSGAAPQGDKTHSFLAAAFTSGISTSAFLDLTGPLFTRIDSHADHDGNQIPAQTEIWNQVAGVFKFFRSIPYGQGSLFDATTFMVVTEFSRTPFLNKDRGTDHNLFTNSVLLAGKGVRGGRVAGASRLLNSQQSGEGHAIHLAIPYDFKTGRLATQASQGRFIVPADVMKTIFHIFGVPASNMPSWMGDAQALTSVTQA